MTKWKVVGINFDHMHMGDLLRMVHEHTNAEIVGICDADPTRMEAVISNFNIPNTSVFSDLDECMLQTKPDLVIVCPAPKDHADYVERVAKYDCAILVEKPFAANLADADRMIQSTKNKILAINWPLAWYPPHVTVKRLLNEGLIGEVVEIHFYDGNRGPLYHLADKKENIPTSQEKQNSWWYSSEAGGGSLLDYLGYGATLGTWYQNGLAPIEITTTLGGDPNLRVDEHSITVARYKHGLSKFETRWGTFTDPWNTQPLPKCGFVVVGTDGAMSSYDFEDHVTVQTRSQPEAYEIPIDTLAANAADPVAYVLHCLETGTPITGPLDPKLCRIGQQIVDTAIFSAKEKRTVELLK
ncbi:MAG: Gfo/Idh/MocA family oxidoreductase [Rhizobiales bacterium]|nr:Gfo/Idh/MocA family oxidoreductase [Hyphomicrobiales bacterium]NRB15820.1 Gfo/Idh/MocA family oxidoreductase [Hyphomicrobiales bacterium]